MILSVNPVQTQHTQGEQVKKQQNRDIYIGKVQKGLLRDIPRLGLGWELDNGEYLTCHHHTKAVDGFLGKAVRCEEYAFRTAASLNFTVFLYW